MQLGTDPDLQYEEVFEHLSYDPDQEAIIYDVASYGPDWAWPDVRPDWSLESAAYDEAEQTCTLTIRNINTKKYRSYTLRFDGDSWRYISIKTLETEPENP